MRRVITVITLALSLLGLALWSLPAAGVQLLTGVNACYAGGEQGVMDRLLFDPKYGTRFAGKPVLWPVGFTGERVGPEVAVRDPAGKVVATTGRAYYISYAPWTYTEGRHVIDGVEVFPAAANCGYPWDFIDCTAAATVPDNNGIASRLCRGLQPI